MSILVGPRLWSLVASFVNKKYISYRPVDFANQAGYAPGIKSERPGGSVFITAQILLTVVTLGYSLVPAIADFNATHATNPLWTPHARFHVVWQVMSYLCFGLMGLYFIWASPFAAHSTGMWIAAALAASAYIGFFSASFGKSIYGGAQYDSNGVPPIRLGALELDVNWTVFTVMAVVWLVGVYCLSTVAAGA